MCYRLNLMRLTVALGLFFCMLPSALAQEQHPRKLVTIHYLTQGPIHVDKESVWTFSVKPTPPLGNDEVARLVEKISAYTNSSLSRKTDIKGAEEAAFFSDPRDPSSILRVSTRTRDVLFSKGLRLTVEKVIRPGFWEKRKHLAQPSSI